MAIDLSRWVSDQNSVSVEVSVLSIWCLMIISTSVSTVTAAHRRDYVSFCATVCSCWNISLLCKHDYREAHAGVDRHEGCASTAAPYNWSLRCESYPDYQAYSQIILDPRNRPEMALHQRVTTIDFSV